MAKTLHIKNCYRKLGNEAPAKRTRRVQAEVALAHAYRKAEKQAEAADGQVVEGLLQEITTGTPWEGKVEELKRLAAKIERECDKILAADKRDEIAEEMIRVKMAKWVEK